MLRVQTWALILIGAFLVCSFMKSLVDEYKEQHNDTGYYRTPV